MNGVYLTNCSIFEIVHILQNVGPMTPVFFLHSIIFSPNMCSTPVSHPLFQAIL